MILLYIIAFCGLCFFVFNFLLLSSSPFGFFPTLLRLHSCAIIVIILSMSLAARGGCFSSRLFFYIGNGLPSGSYGLCKVTVIPILIVRDISFVNTVADLQKCQDVMVREEGALIIVKTLILKSIFNFPINAYSIGIINISTTTIVKP